MVLAMKTTDRISLNTILQHKEHFDQKLILIATNSVSDIKRLENKILLLEQRNQEYSHKNKGLHLKVEDLKSQNYTKHQLYLEVKNERDEILEEFKRLQKEIDALKQEAEKQRQEILRQEIEIQKEKKNINRQKQIIKKYKNMNSSNSNLPSSLDILTRTRAKAQANTRIKTDRKRGGQMNHPLHKSILSKDIDEVIVKRVKKAPLGAVPYKNQDEVIEYYITQEINLTLKSNITETRYYIDKEGIELEGTILKKHAINPLVYGGDFKAAVVYLNQKGTIPLERLCDMMKDISKGSIQLRPGTIVKWCKECQTKSDKEIETIVSDILDGEVIHVDETGVKINGKQQWVHVITNEKAAFFLLTEKRGDKEKGPVGILETYTGTLVHDHFSTYQQLKECTHAECNAHIDRYLKSGIEFDKSEDCKKMLELMHQMLKRKKELIIEGKTEVSKEEMALFESRYELILKEGIASYNKKHPKIAKKYEAEYVKVFKRMLVYKEDHLRFMDDFNIPYTNNAAERQCRAVKAKKNTSKQFITEQGGEAYVNILSLLQTAKIKKENALEVLERVFN